MNHRVKSLLLFILFGVLSYTSHFLWALPPYGSILNPILVVFSVLLGIVAAYWFIKLLFPKYNLTKFIHEFLAGL